MNVAGRQCAGSRSQIGGTELERIHGAGSAVDGVPAGALDPPSRVIRGADAIDRPHRDEFSDGVHSLLDRHRPVLLMQPEQIDRIDAEPVQAACEGRPDRGCRKSLALLGPATDDSRFRAELGSDLHQVADTWPGRQPSTEQRLTLPAVPCIAGPERIAICRVDPFASGLDEPVQECEGSRFVDACAEHHRAEHQGGGCHVITLRPGVCFRSSAIRCRLGAVIHPRSDARVTVRTILDGGRRRSARSRPASALEVSVARSVHEACGGCCRCTELSREVRRRVCRSSSDLSREVRQGVCRCHRTFARVAVTISA